MHTVLRSVWVGDFEEEAGGILTVDSNASVTIIEIGELTEGDCPNLKSSTPCRAGSTKGQHIGGPGCYSSVVLHQGNGRCWGKVMAAGGHSFLGDLDLRVSHDEGRVLF